MLKDVDIPAPPPHKQRRIVARVEELFARIEEARRLQAESAAELERLSRAVLARAFRGEL